jgi:hypothetical protein
MVVLLCREDELVMGVSQSERRTGGHVSAEMFSCHQEAAEGTCISGILGNLEIGCDRSQHEG